MKEPKQPLQFGALQINVANASSAQARACIDAYFRELQERFAEGFDRAMTVTADPAELTPPAGYFLLASLDGDPVGCVGLKVNADVGEIKRMWVDPQARGRGVAQKMLDAVESIARNAGITTLRLDTNRNLKEAQSLYRRNGYREIPAYNDNPYAHHWFEKRL